MNFIFLDNIRGFSNCTVPLLKANFLVGENSTGKTSFLAILNLLSNPDFWMSQDFNTKEYNFGVFKDIVSASSDKNKGFYIGLLRMKDNTPEIGDCFLFRFDEKDGQPFISLFLQVKNKILSSIILQSNNMMYKIDDKLDLNKPDPMDLFNLLINHVSTNKTGYKKLPKAFNQIPKHMIGAYSAVLDSLSKMSKKHDFLMIPALARNFTWLAPIRTEPKRTYDGFNRSFSPDGGHTPYLIRKKLRPGSKSTEFKLALESFGISSGLFKEVKVKEFGKDYSSPFELNIILNKHPLKINSVGYGVSQVLPVVVELLERVDNTWFAIQQPEVHLHPKAQAALGELMFFAIASEDKHIFVETHSDYLIDRFRFSYKKFSGRRPAAQVLFFDRQEDSNKVYPIPITKTGEYSTNQPDNFREFFLSEQLSLLEI